MTKKFYLTALTLVVYLSISAQPKTNSTSTILQDLKKLNVLGSVLYVAAHPDDENTSLIAYYANEELFRTGYLAATRGDGGQNLIGPEIREQLGVIRTQELLSARWTDNGEQMFSRANDFGYSKNPEETFKMWDKQEILSDFVWAFRKFRPDVIITRFDDQPPNHGHHTASAILAREAFKLSGDENAFPEQLKYVEAWQPKRIYWNTHPFFFQRRGIEFDSTKYAKVNVGKYNPVLGTSYTEISARSRSMHKSQGFGASGSRGDNWQYLDLWEGPESLEPFEGVDTSWGRVEGGKKVIPIIDEAISSFNPSNPSEVVSRLLAAREVIQNRVKNAYWKKIKLTEINKLILAVTGTYLEVRADDYAYAPGDSIRLTIEAINRSATEIGLMNVDFGKISGLVQVGNTLNQNARFTKDWSFKLSNDLPYSNPYWLEDKGTLGRYSVKDQLMRGLPENPAVFNVRIGLEVSGEKLIVVLPVVFKRNDPVDGEVYRPLVIQPPVMANIESSSLIFSSNDPKQVDVRVIAGKDNYSGSVKLDLPKGWISSPALIPIDLKTKDEEKVFTFSITPPEKASEGEVSVVMTSNDGMEVRRGRVLIEYNHIPTQTLFPTSGTRVVKIDVKSTAKNIGYIMGAGDDIPQNLEQIGLRVTLLDQDDITLENLQKYDAVVTGVRAFNTLDWLAFKNKVLFEYVEQGGNMLVQYNKLNRSERLVTENIAPYSIKISQDRVSVEDSEVRILAPNHAVLNFPNKITQADFSGWVQERGLYFPNEWSEKFTPILSSNDRDEDPRDGGLLVAKYGEGYYVYSSYSWFRELPAGVSGAYRIFANLISLGND